MPSSSFPTQSVAVAGTGSSANLIASSAGQSIRAWQLVASGTVADTTGVLTWTVAGTATSMKFTVGSTPTIFPMTGVPWPKLTRARLSLSPLPQRPRSSRPTPRESVVSYEYQARQLGQRTEKAQKQQYHPA